MIEKSTEYRNAIYAPTRMTSFNASFGFVPEGAIEGATVTATVAKPYSDLSQVKDGTTEMGAFWRTLGDWVLDGRTKAIDGSGQLAYWSTPSAADGSLSNCSVLFTMDGTYNLVGCTIVFDTLADEYSHDFVVEMLNASNGVIASKHYTDNNSASVLVDLQANGVKAIRLTLNDWCLPMTSPRITEFVAGQVYSFDLNNGLKMEVIEDMVLWSDGIPANSLEVTIDNSDRKFDFLNPDSVLQKLEPRMMINSTWGIDINGNTDRTNAGSRRFYSIPTDEQTRSAVFDCRPMLSFADKIYAGLLANGTAQSLVNRLWSQAGFPESCTIAPELANITVGRTVGADDNATVADMMTDLAASVGGYWQFDREGNAHLKVLPAEVSADYVATISYDDMIEKPNITQATPYTGVSATYQVSADLERTSFRTMTAVYGNQNGQVIKWNCPLIRSQATALEIAERCLAWHQNRPLRFNIKYRGDFALEIGDVVRIETDYGWRNIEIVRHTLSIDADNFLTGTIEGVG